MVAGGATPFGGWGITKASQRGTRLLQEFAARGLSPEVRADEFLEPPTNPNGADSPDDIDAAIAAAVAIGTSRSKYRAHELRRMRVYLSRIVYSKYFSNFMLLVIFANCITIGIDTSLPDDQTDYSLYTDLIFLSIYLIEFILKIFIDPRGYWRSAYNKFDFVILVISVVQFALSLLGAGLGNLTFLRVFRSLRALRSFRSISSVRRLQIIVNALLHTLRKSVLDILACLFAFTFIFAVMGYYLFGVDNRTNSDDFSTLGASMLSLMYYITSSGWTDVQTGLTQDGYVGSEFYSIIFMVISNFIFTNMFIGVICENIEEASEADRANQLRIRLAAQREKKEAFRDKQRNDMRELLARTDLSSNQNMQKILESLAGTLRHDEVVPMTHLACNLTWFEAFMVTQYHLENSMYRCQQTHFSIANTLTEMLDRRLKAKVARGM
ncbi:Ion transport protein-domain-containing protein [Catenaria anguillulae PL171]|uniref:Ion transport protein-domain-containing protein n=1 Tax=Catenaria anguillulae PL171 TaxID=765915 RepID=A0A1Y2H836_9FUNG|nr:Ion transport protein-domain-containing protein [Catenaria anguillulae PL171]